MMEDRQANSAAAAASSSSSSSRMRQMSGSAASADGSVSNSATRGGGQATAAATTAASTSEGDDAAQSGAAALTKEELALEDRRRRNRETQRAIRKRKATRLQESEVKVVLQEGEMQRLRSMLESVEQENAVLREKLAHCTCGPYLQHHQQQPLAKPKIGMGRTLIVDGLQGVAAAAAAAAAQEDEEKTPVLPAYPATSASSSFAFHFPQRAPEHISHVHVAPPHMDDHREPEGNAASSSGSGSSGTVLETRRPTPPRRRRRLSSSSAAVVTDEHMQMTALEDDRFSSSSSTSSRHRDSTSVLGKRKPSITPAPTEENLAGEFAFPVTRGHPRSGPSAHASPLSAPGSRPRPSVLQGPLSYESVVPTGPGSTASSTTTVLASLPSRDLTRTSTISTTTTSRSSNPTSSSSSIPTRTSSQSSYPPSSPPSAFSSFSGPSTSAPRQEGRYVSGASSYSHTPLVGSPLAIESQMSDLTTHEAFHRSSQYEQDHRSDRSRHFSTSHLTSVSPTLSHPALATHMQPQNECRDPSCSCYMQKPTEADRPLFRDDHPRSSAYEPETLSASAPSRGPSPMLSRPTSEYEHYGKGTHASPRNVLPPMRSGPLIHHAETKRGSELGEGGAYIPSGLDGHSTGQPLPPPHSRHAQLLTRNGKGKSSSFPVTATDYEGVQLPPLGQMYAAHREGGHSKVSASWEAGAGLGVPQTAPYQHLSSSPRAPVAQYPSSATRLSDKMEEEGEDQQHGSVMSKPLVNSPLSSPQFLDEERYEENAADGFDRHAGGHSDVQMEERTPLHSAGRSPCEPRGTKLPSLPSMLEGPSSHYEEHRLQSQLSHSTVGSVRSTLDDFEELFGERPTVAPAEAQR